MRFRLTPRSMTLDDLELLLDQFCQQRLTNEDSPVMSATEL